MSEENAKENDWKQREIGALWKKEGKNQNYFSGRLKLKDFEGKSELNIVGFSNKKKEESPNAPDVILYVSATREGSVNLTKPPFKKKVEEKAEPDSKEAEEDDDGQSLPF
jgi:hypothetical protein